MDSLFAYLCLLQFVTTSRRLSLGEFWICFVDVMLILAKPIISRPAEEHPLIAPDIAQVNPRTRRWASCCASLHLLLTPGMTKFRSGSGENTPARGVRRSGSIKRKRHPKLEVKITGDQEARRSSKPNKLG
ncbi:hypothetical protein FA13DRAFT_975050 [Coprinellus micaceus]|uniref:Uncharacterized protein n=1 Tax=Coprinellus micaceus TaxID=71717 RepID=A0A4Y7SZK7_COPMI|nr:hypothetical protein FA13DRAFT_975050 [Coprinellus micaceus]